MEFDLLKEQLAAMQKRLYGNSSEKRPNNTDAPNTEEKKPRRGHGPRNQPDLPIEVVKGGTAYERHPAINRFKVVKL